MALRRIQTTIIWSGQYAYRWCSTNCAHTENNVSNGQENGRFRGLVTVRSMTDFQGLVNTMMYVRTALHIMICTPKQGHRLRGRPNINLQQQPDDNEYGKPKWSELLIFAMIMAEGINERAKEPTYEWNVHEILSSDNQTDTNRILSEWKWNIPKTWQRRMKQSTGTLDKGDERTYTWKLILETQAPE